jgi:hypothetical protein
VAPVPQGDSHFADQTWPVFDLSEEKKTGVGANLSAIEIGLDFLVRNTLKKEQLCSTTFHGCFLFFLLLTYYMSMRYERKQHFFLNYSGKIIKIKGKKDGVSDHDG